MGLSIDEYWYWFVNINGVGRITRNKLLNHFGSVVEVYNCSETVIKNMEFLNEKQKNNILVKNSDGIKHDYLAMMKKGISFIHQDSVDFPEKLMDIPDKPHGLYCKGEYKKILEDNRFKVAIVGSRKCSAYGNEAAYKIGYELGARGICVVSGMARGIDGAAEKGCLNAGGKSAAVLGCGVDICYPGDNIDLYMNIARNGVLISENNPGTKPSAGLFPERNRLISGLADAIIVVEAGEKSGTFITVDMALEQGKEVYALPGRITDLQSRGCNRLIKQGAQIFESVTEFLNDMEFFQACRGMNNETYKMFYDMKIDEKRPKQQEQNMIYSILDMKPKHIDDIVKETGIALCHVMNHLIDMEINGIVRQTVNNYYVLNI